MSYIILPILPDCFLTTSAPLEEICANYYKVDKIIANVNKIFSKRPYRIVIFKDKAPNIPLPPAPILTRWGTCIRLMLMYHKFIINNDAVEY